MIVIYVAGPYRAANSWEIERNIRRAETAALQLWRYGFVAVCPHAMTRYYQGALPDAVWLAGDLELVRRCDAVLLSDGWRESPGAQAEKRWAEDQGIPVFQNLEAVLVWAESVQGRASLPAPAPTS